MQCYLRPAVYLLMPKFVLNLESANLATTIRPLNLHFRIEFKAFSGDRQDIRPFVISGIKWDILTEIRYRTRYELQ